MVWVTSKGEKIEFANMQDIHLQRIHNKVVNQGAGFDRARIDGVIDEMFKRGMLTFTEALRFRDANQSNINDKINEQDWIYASMLEHENAGDR